MSASLVTLKHCQNSIQSVWPLTSKSYYCPLTVQSEEDTQFCCGHLVHIVRCVPVQGLQPRSMCQLNTQWCVQGLNRLKMLTLKKGRGRREVVHENTWSYWPWLVYCTSVLSHMWCTNLLLWDCRTNIQIHGKCRLLLLFCYFVRYIFFTVIKMLHKSVQ